MLSIGARLLILKFTNGHRYIVLSVVPGLPVGRGAVCRHEQTAYRSSIVCIDTRVFLDCDTLAIYHVHATYEFDDPETCALVAKVTPEIAMAHHGPLPQLHTHRTIHAISFPGLLFDLSDYKLARSVGLPWWSMTRVTTLRINAYLLLILGACPLAFELAMFGRRFARRRRARERGFPVLLSHADG